VDVPEETNKELKKNYDLFKSKHNLWWILVNYTLL
jgi:hypothetical protein